MPFERPKCLPSFLRNHISVIFSSYFLVKKIMKHHGEISGTAVFPRKSPGISPQFFATAGYLATVPTDESWYLLQRRASESTGLEA